VIDDMTALSGWENFYVIVGSSAGALIGLQFVVMTLIANRPIAPGEAQAGDTFTTPTVVHFGVVLLLSAAASAPWDGIAAVAVLWGVVGLSGIVYAGRTHLEVLRRRAVMASIQAKLCLYGDANPCGVSTSRCVRPVVYVVLVTWRMRLQVAYQAVLEDWLFHVLLPFAAYTMLAASACAAYFHPRPALFLVGAAVLLLLFTGIHNAWDIITYHVFVKRREPRDSERHQ
jgi:hypothetical protein